MNKIINFSVYLNKKIVLDYLAPFFIFLIFFVIGLNVYKDYGISFDEDLQRDAGRLYYYYLKSFLTNNIIIIQLIFKKKECQFFCLIIKKKKLHHNNNKEKNILIFLIFEKQKVKK